MQYDKINGLEKSISKLIIGNDNQTDYDEAAKLWDHWIDVGGNAFDNAHIYGGGSMETLLGKWHKTRNNLNDLVIIAKGPIHQIVIQKVFQCNLLSRWMTKVIMWIFI